MDFYTKENYHFSVMRYSSNIIRVRLQQVSCGAMEESFMERLKLLGVPDIFENPEISENADSLTFSWEDMKFSVDTDDLVFSIVSDDFNIKGQVKLGKQQSSCDFKVNEKEKFFGLGFRKIDDLNLRGKVYRSHVTYGAAYGPQPFIYSNNGYGIYLNSVIDSYFDVCSKKSDELQLIVGEKVLDFFLFIGNPVTILNAYTKVTGRPYLMPKNSYGLMFIGNEKETQFDIMNDVEHFLKEKIPCNYIGLEPGWMETKYDVTVDKAWNQERFYMPYWSDDRKQFQPETFIGALKRKGFDLSLWLCCDYDIFWAEQERLKDHTSVLEEFEFNERDFDDRAHTPIYMDKVTKREVTWFEHLKKFIDDGVTAFKQDPAFIANDHPDRLYAEKYTDKEIHNIYVTVLARQIYEGYKEYTGTRPMYYTGTSFTGIQQWSPSWTCDCGGREEALMGVLLSGMCGHMNMTCDLDITTKDGMHFGFLLPWSQINSWASLLQPWYMASDMYETFQFYANLHDQLLPYLYSYARKGHDTGMPIVRALPLCYPEDDNAYQANRQYLLGDYLLVGCFDHRLYLPEGEWFDYWTNERYEGKQWVEASWPDTRGGALFVKAGGIIPMKDTESGEITCNVYPGTGFFELYEDDGISFDYETGKYSITKISSNSYEGKCKVSIVKDSREAAKNFAKNELKFQSRINNATVEINVGAQEE